MHMPQPLPRRCDFFVTPGRYAGRLCVCFFVKLAWYVSVGRVGGARRMSPPPQNTGYVLVSYDHKTHN